MRKNVLGASEEVALVSKKAAFLLRGKERRKVPLWNGMSRGCGQNADGVIEGEKEGATEVAIDGLYRRMGGSTGVFEADRVRTWENAWMAVFFALSFSLVP
jgi:hypothetical protein